MEFGISMKHELKNKELVEIKDSVLLKYWFIGLITYALLMLLISVQPKITLISALGFSFAILISVYGYLKYQRTMINKDLSFCKIEAGADYHGSPYRGARNLLNYRNYAQVSLSKRYLNGRGIEKNKRMSLHWAEKAYRNSNSYVDEYTLISLEELSKLKK